MIKYINILLALTINIFISNHYSASVSSIFHNSVVLKNSNELLPLKSLDTLAIASLNLSSDNLNVFNESCNYYTNVEHFDFNTFSSKRMVKSMIKELNTYNIIIINADTIQEVIANMISDIGGQKKNNFKLYWREAIIV